MTAVLCQTDGSEEEETHKGGGKTSADQTQGVAIDSGKGRIGKAMDKKPTPDPKGKVKGAAGGGGEAEAKE